MKKFIFLFIVLFFSTNSIVLAKPMPEPLEEKAYKSQWIVIAQYQGYSANTEYPGSIDNGKITYFNFPIAKYKVVRLLKGAAVPPIVDVLYAFHDGSPCMADENWKLKDALPKRGSKWILFLNEFEGHNYLTTYGGDFGRWPATKKKILEVEKQL